MLVGLKRERERDRQTETEREITSAGILMMKKGEEKEVDEGLLLSVGRKDNEVKQATISGGGEGREKEEGVIVVYQESNNKSNPSLNFL